MENQNTNGTVTDTQQERTFTQDQVNAIVGKRLAEAKSSAESELSRREQELNQREMAIRAKELLSERKLPTSLADVLRYSDEESLVKAIDAIEKTRGFSNKSGNNDHPSGKGHYEGFRPVDKNTLPTYGESDPFRKAMGLE